MVKFNQERPLRYRFWFTLWHCWHVTLAWRTFGVQDDGRPWSAVHNSPRPWWHLCCNGNAGGWRTGLCDYLERKWRALDDC